MPDRPMTMNTQRQLNCVAKRSMPPCPMAAKLVPVLKMPVASERWRLGNHSAIALMHAGKLVASPIPKTKRAAAKPTTDDISAWLMAATLQRVTPSAKPIFTPNLSIRCPAMGNMPAYARAKQKLIQPNSASSQPMVVCNIGASAPSETRST
jgi:hypothetical protein